MFVTPSYKSRARGYAPVANGRRGFTRGWEAITRSTQCRSIRDKGGKVKIKGRFIAVLAAVGLLVALLPALPTGAVAGTVALSGGAGGEGLYFSDKTGNNLVNIGVTDEDLSPVRVGKARYLAPPSAADYLIGEGIINGNKPKTDKLDGGTINGPCARSLLDDDSQRRRRTADSMHLTTGIDPDCSLSGPLPLSEPAESIRAPCFI